MEEKIYYETGEVMYKGEVKEGLPEGKGTMFYTNGKVMYVGDFKEGKRNGYGEYLLPCGKLKYTGEWVNGKPNGKGIRYKLENDKIEHKGKFKYGKPVKTFKLLKETKQYYITDIDGKGLKSEEIELYLGELDQSKFKEGHEIVYSSSEFGEITLIIRGIHFRAVHIEIQK